MKRHAGYVFGLVMNGPGGNSGKGSGWGKTATLRDGAFGTRTVYYYRRRAV